MNIRRAFNFLNRQSSSTHSPQPPNSGSTDSEQGFERTIDSFSNVVQLPAGTPLDTPAGLVSQSSSMPVETTKPLGLLDAPELQAFFSDNHFGLGRHNGAQYKTNDALELGRQTLVSKFQNTLELLIAQKQAKVDALRNMALQTQGVCATVTSQLNLACQRLERDISSLHTQFELAEDGKGWVLKSLNEYQTGFGKGLREAVDMELLG